MRFPILGTALLAIVVGACASAKDPPIANGTTFTDFETLDPPTSPNRWLVAPAGASIADKADATAPTFEVAADRLVEAWTGVVRKQPRVRFLGTSPDGLQVEAEQRSALVGFVDRISFRAVPLAAGQSTLYAYSRSEVGYWDLGVNRSRLKSWLTDLRTILNSEPASR